MPGQTTFPAGHDSPSDWTSPDGDPAGASIRPKVMLVLLLLLPLFGQFFSYMKDLLPLWSLAKAFPVLSLPLAFVMLRNASVPMTKQVMISFLWLTLVPSFTAIFSFNQDFFVGITAQVKLLPILFFFSFLGLLLWLEPTLEELTVGYVACGIATYLALIVLWAVIPQSWYSGHYTEGTSPLFSSDDRGNRIRMPMYFGVVTLFYCYRRFLETPRLSWLLFVAAGFGLTMGVVRTRAMVIGISGVLVINTFLAASKWLRMAVLLLAPVALGGLFSVGYLGSLFKTDASSGFDLRWTTVLKALGFLGLDPVRWILGVGTISPTNADNLFSYFDHFFFLADITWLGIIFEYGLVGALLFVLYELRGLLFYRALRARVHSPFLGSLKDYLIYVLLISTFYPPSLTPGETATILAIFAYVWHWLQTQDADEVEAETERA